MLQKLHRENEFMMSNSCGKSHTKRSQDYAPKQKILPYKNKCILFKKLVCLFTNNPNLVKKVHSWLDNETATDLKRRLSQTTDERLRNDANDAWPVDIKGSLLGINNLVTNKTLLHNTHHFQRREQRWRWRY